MSSSHLRSLRPTWESIPGTYVIECDVEGCGLAKTNFDSGNEEEARAGQERAAGQLGLLSEVEQALAAVLEEAGGEESLRVTYFAHDVPFAMAGHEFRSSLEDAASVGEGERESLNRKGAIFPLANVPSCLASDRPGRTSTRPCSSRLGFCLPSSQTATNTSRPGRLTGSRVFHK